MQFTIDKEVPIPSKRSCGVGRPRKYPHWDMAVGDSYFIPNVTISNMNGTLTYAQERTGKRFSRRSVTENGVPGVRVWRIE